MNQTSTIRTGNDVVSFLKDQHRRAEALFAKVASTSGREREDAFRELRRLLVVHETAEEEIVHPAARSVLANGDAVIGARLREENEGKKMLAALEKLDLASPEFDAQLRGLEAAIVAHGRAEEREEFDALADKLDPQRLARMRKAVELAEAIAPTHPHPGVESAIGNMLLGPFIAMVDRARDAMEKKN
jgi:hemerythrin superfamily protein